MVTSGLGWLLCDGHMLARAEVAPSCSYDVAWRVIRCLETTPSRIRDELGGAKRPEVWGKERRGQRRLVTFLRIHWNGRRCARDPGIASECRRAAGQKCLGTLSVEEGTMGRRRTTLRRARAAKLRKERLCENRITRLKSMQNARGSDNIDQIC